MTNEEAIKQLNAWAMRGYAAPVVAIHMAIEALSAEQKEEELAKDIARRMATIIENEEDMRVILKNASAEPTDLISRADAIDAVCNDWCYVTYENCPHVGDGYRTDGCDSVETIKQLPSAEQVTGKLNNPCDSLLKADSESCKEQKSKLDLISRADAVKPFCIAPDGTRIPEVDCDNFPVEFSVEFIKKHLMSLTSADRPSGEWIPVSERLPEFDTKVLAWVENKDPKNRFNKPGIYIAELKDKEVEHDPDGDRNFWGIPGYDSVWAVWAWSYFAEPDVKAWMPLPKQYKGGEEE